MLRFTSGLKMFSWVVLVTLVASSAAAQTVIKMGYRTSEKLPYIAEFPSNAGLYYDLYSEAAQRIGAKLDVVRTSKQRVLLDLEEGIIDFYPGFSFSEERANYAFWIKNGLIQRDVVVSRADQAELQTAADLAGLRYVLSLGNPDQIAAIANQQAIKITASELDIERALTMISRNLADLYVYEEDSLKYFIKSHGLSGYRFHEQLIDNFYYSHAGFSRYSPLFQGQRNANFDDALPVDIGNFPFELVPGSTLAKFEQALWQMYEDGTTKAIYKAYFE